MQRILGIALLICTLPVEAAAIEMPNNKSCAALEDLIAFALAETESTELIHCPHITVVESHVLISSMKFLEPRDQNEPMAVYLPTCNSILVSHEIDVSSAEGRSFLVHELVHALQFQSGEFRDRPCLGDLEAEAYRVQADYLEQEGHSEEALTFRLYGLAMASCAQAYHPDF